MQSTKGEAGAVVQSDEFYDAMDRAGIHIYTHETRTVESVCPFCFFVCVCVENHL